MRVIYDFGANNGDDIPYYLLKADLVVAIEANPVLANEIRNRFSKEITCGRLVVESCVLTADESALSLPFYVAQNHVQSTFVRPSNVNNTSDWTEIQVPARNVVEIIRQHGEPYYIKIDIEHYDQYILKALFNNNIRPPYISCEAHIIDIFCILAGHGDYNRFKLVHGSSVAGDYANQQVTALDGSTHSISWPHHSAGPFGEEVHDDWRNTGDFFNYLKGVSLGWIDIHATRHDD
jgi:FkbM family methyltransferase